MEKTTTQKFRLGLFVVIGTLIFILAMYFIGSKQQLFSSSVSINAVFDNASGLQIGNNVRYSGINIGTVREIKMINDTAICISMVIDKESFQFIKKDAIASIGSDGLVGNMIVNIVPGKGNPSPLITGDTIRTIRKVRTDDMMNTLSVTNNNAALLTADLLKITHEITQGEGTLGLLLKDTVMARDLKQTLYFLKVSSKETAQTVQRLNALIKSLDNKNNTLGVIKDTAVAGKVKSIISNLDESSQEMHQVVTNLNATIVNMKDGKGAINYLSNDPKLVKKIDSTIVNINEASLLLNQNLEALKHSFLLRGYFKKQEKEKKKAEKKANN